MDFVNKVVIVTGASSGIGASTALLFAKQHANLVLVGRNVLNLENNARKCEECNGVKPIIVKAEMTNKEDVQDIIRKTVDAYGRIDVLVNNAGVGVMGKITDGIESYDKCMNVNVRSVYFLTSLAVPFLIKSKGNIVNVSSIAGTKPISDLKLLAYGMSKAALDHFTKHLALDLGPCGVRVNSVNPGATKTNFMLSAGAKLMAEISNSRETRTPLRKMGTCDEVADLIVYLASDRSRSITGSLFVIDNGESIS